MLKWILTFIISTSVFALPTSKNEFCTRLQNKSTIKEQSLNVDNLVAFKNDGGLFDGGVCWWHSRFQRNTLYLVKINPNGNKPTLSEAKELIKRIRSSNEVLTLNGFSSFNEFTKSYQKEIQKELNAWQLYDGIVLGGWIDGIKGDTKIPASELQNKMDELFSYVEVQKKIAYQKLQIKGITSHAWLVTDIKATGSGYDVGFIDSNDPMRLNLYRYKFGDESFNISGYGNFVPYLEFKREEDKLNQVAQNFCNTNFTITFNENDYEQDLYDFANNY
jgi:hypothetical protein